MAKFQKGEANPGKLFVKGQSGNPGGRPKTLIDMQELARSHTGAAIQALVDALKDDKQRVSAAQVLLDRGWGKPQQTIEGTGSMTMTILTGVPRAPDDGTAG